MSSTALLDPRPRCQTRAARSRFGYYMPRIGLSVLVFLAAGETVTRLVFYRGASFSAHGGPIVSRFEQSFRYNAFDFGGPSRGPDFSDSAGPAAVRIVVQGDSVTWGQGILDEADLYTAVLLRRLRRRGVSADMAVVATPGKGIEDHLQALRHYGDTLRSDLLIYQWFVNDLELDTSLRPKPFLPWRRLGPYRAGATHSYLWFLVDYHLVQLLARPGGGLTTYLLEVYGRDTAEWDRFVLVLERWANEARQLSPRLLVVLVPRVVPDEGFALEAVHRRVVRACRSLEVQTLDLAPHIDSIVERVPRWWASRWDIHPGPEVHSEIGAILERELAQTWPELFEPLALIGHAGERNDRRRPSVQQAPTRGAVASSQDPGSTAETEAQAPRARRF